MATIDASIGTSQAGFLQRNLSAFSQWVGNNRSIRFLEIFSVIAIISMAIFTFAFIDGKDNAAEPLSPTIAASLLVANLLPATMLLVLIGRRLALRRAELVSFASRQRLHVRLVAIFSLISAAPTLLLVIFASLLFQSGVQFWFSGSARGMLENAGDLAAGYYQEKQRDIRDETVTMADDIRGLLKEVNTETPEFFDAYLFQIKGRKLTESAIVSVGKNRLQKTEFLLSADDKPEDFEWIDSAILKRLEKGERTVVVTKADKIEAVTKLFDTPETYLYTNRAESLPTFSMGTKAQSVLKDYRAMELRSRTLQLQFNAALYFVSLFIICVTVWVALIVADRLVRPVTNLVSAAQKIADGDMSARVDESRLREDEVGFLSQSFNRMAERLQNQTGTLISANRQLDDRRAFIETVLESVSAGIISLNNKGEVQLANSTAEKLLSGKLPTIVGSKFADVSPDLAQLVERHQPRAVLQLGDGPEPLTVAVKIVAEEQSSVVTFEDISQQLADQRRAAWSDVARRIAHEIKNPLTPIQLAAERLQRRFSKDIVQDQSIFEQLTSTIVRQVGDLRNIVDEFSSFARMPKPSFKNEDLHDIVGHSVFLHEVAHPGIRFEYSSPEGGIMLICDRRQLGQAFTNILKNAVEAIEENNIEQGLINISLTSEDGRVSVSFADNGPGLPEERDRIVEPYVTTRNTGSGLGLAIVHKIVEEHFAEISFGDQEAGGAIITISFSPESIAEKTGLKKYNKIKKAKVN